MALEGQEIACTITLGHKGTQQTLGGGLLTDTLTERGLSTSLWSNVGDGEEARGASMTTPIGTALLSPLAPSGCITLLITRPHHITLGGGAGEERECWSGVWMVTAVRRED